MLSVLLAITIIAECVAVPVFLHYYWPTKNKYSMASKIVASVLFILCGVLAVKISGNTSLYADYIVYGLIFGCLGDLFLHSLSNKMWHFALGVIAFLTGHIYYIAALQKAILSAKASEPFFAWYEFLIVGIIIVVALTYCFKTQQFKRQAAKTSGLCVYGVFLAYMFAKAIRYVIVEIEKGTNDNMLPIAITIGLGALLFLTSDLILGYILANDDKELKRIFRIVNIVTYYAAQVLIALSIFFVKSRELY